MPRTQPLRAITHVHAGGDGRSLRSSEDRGMIDFIEGTVESKAPASWSSARAAWAFC